MRREGDDCFKAAYGTGCRVKGGALEVESKAIQVADWIIEKGVGGFGSLSGADALADEYLNDKSYKDDEERVWSLIKWETSKNVGSGFATGLGGLATLPFSLPVALGSSWLLQARLSAAVARIYGHNLKEDRVRTLILLSILGDAGLKEPLKVAGLKITELTLKKGVKALPTAVLRQVNQAVGMRLITKAGTSGIVNLTKLIPFVSGVVGGIIDGASCYAVGAAAEKIFSPKCLDQGVAAQSQTLSIERKAG